MAGEMVTQFQANLTADPEMVQVGDKQVCKLRLAHNTRSKRGGEWVSDETWWIEGTVWPAFDGDPFPENVAASLRSGVTVDVIARLKRDPWESREGKSGISYRASVQSIGASLKRATVQVVRNEKGSAGGSGGGAATQSGWGSQPQAQQGWGQAAVPQAAPAAAPAPQAQVPSQSAQQEFGGFDDEPNF